MATRPAIFKWRQTEPQLILWCGSLVPVEIHICVQPHLPTSYQIIAFGFGRVVVTGKKHKHDDRYAVCVGHSAVCTLSVRPIRIRIFGLDGTHHRCKVSELC